jgi:L-cystine transport system permease protein
MRPFQPLLILDLLPELLPYLLVSLEVVIGTIFFGAILGIILTYMKINGSYGQSHIAHLYTYIARCTPSIVLLFIVFYGLPKIILELFSYNINNLNKIVFVIATFSLLYAASVSEVMRAAYYAVDRGQYESAVSAGLTPFQALYRIMAPQAMIVALPNFSNSVINLLKEGSLAYTIGLVDLLGKGNLIIAHNYGSFVLEVYLAMAIIYWSVTIVLEKSFFHLEDYLLNRKKIRTV